MTDRNVPVQRRTPEERKAYVQGFLAGATAALDYADREGSEVARTRIGLVLAMMGLDTQTGEIRDE